MIPNPYNTAATLQEILASKRAEARQAMLDQLNQKNVESEITSRAENTRSLAESRQAQEDQRNLAFLTAGGHQKGEDISGLDPSMLSVAEKAGLVNHSIPSPTPTVTTSDQSGEPPITTTGTPLPPQTGKFYRGNPADIEADRFNSEMGNIPSGYWTDPKISPVEKMMKYSQMARTKPSTLSEFHQLTETPPENYVLDADTGKVSKPQDQYGHDLPANAKLTTRSRTPSPPAPIFNFGLGVDAETHLPAVGNGRTGTVAIQPVQGGSGKGIETRPAAPKPYQIQPAAQKLLATLRSKVVPTGGFMGMGGQPKAGDIAAWKQAAEIQISNYPTSPDIRDTIRDIVDFDGLPASDPNSTISVSTSDIVKDHSKVFDPAQLEQFNDLLRIVRGE